MLKIEASSYCIFSLVSMKCCSPPPFLITVFLGCFGPGAFTLCIFFDPCVSTFYDILYASGSLFCLLYPVSDDGIWSPCSLP